MSKLKKNQRDYTVLEFLLTKPRLTYLAKIRNPNTERDKLEPFSLQEYKKKMDVDPFQEGAARAPRASGEHAGKGEQ